MPAAIFLEYTIHLRDRDEAAEESAAVARINSPINSLTGTLVDMQAIWRDLYEIEGATGFVCCSPRRAADFFNAQIVELSNPVIPASGNYITSSWILLTEQGTHLPLQPDQFDRTGQGIQGLPPVRVGLDVIYTFVWYGKFAYAAGLTPSPGETDYGSVQRRRWIDGFEAPLSAGGTGGTTNTTTLDASRHIGQLGLAMRSWSNIAITRSVSEFVTGLTPSASWERMYIRIRKLPSSTMRFWRANSSLSASVGPGMGITPAGALALFLTDTSADTLLGVTPNLDVDTWYRVDILFKSGASGEALAKIYVNGVLRISYGFGSGTNNWNNGSATHSQSILGSNTAAFDLGLDVDDWICADYPPEFPPGHEDEGEDDLTGMDWRNGSKVVPISVADTAEELGSYTGDPRWLKRIPGQTDIGSDNVTSSTPGDVFEIGTNSERMVEGDLKAIAAGEGNPPGAVAIAVGQFASRGGVGNGSLGFSVAGAAAVDTSVTQSTVVGWQSVMYNPSGLTEPFAVSPLLLRSVKGAGASGAVLRALHAQAELLGTFGPEDGGETPFPQAGVHAARYPESPFARFGPPPPAPVILKTDTFEGNDTETILTFDAPLTWFFCRRVAASGTVQNTLWWSSMQAGVANFAIAKKPDVAVRVELDPTYAPTDTEDVQEWRYRVRIIGTQVGINDVAEDYQYVALCDPGMRFTQNGILRHDRTGGGNIVTTVPIPEWGDGIEAVFFHKHQAQETPATTIETYFKGRGQAALSSLTTTAEAALATIDSSAGTITTGTSFHWTTSAGDEITYAAFKRDDGSADPENGYEENEFATRLIRLGSYTGDGSASRTVNLTPESGYRPVFALVVPRNASVALFRDPTHATTNSCTIAGTTNASTGIIGGGLDQFSVGSVLNGSGVTYDYLVFLGEADACNGGWGCNVEVILPPIVPPFWPPGGGTVPPFIPPGGGTVPPTIPPGGGGGPGPGPGPGGGTIDLEECPEESQKVCNQALSLIGVTSPIRDITEDVTPEAEQCRLHYEDAVAVVLKSHNWNWATGYAELELVEGSEDEPVNGDWIYSYRCPEGMIHPRRIVNPDKGRDYDPTPIKFRHGHDQEGTGLIYTDWSEDDSSAGTVELEYTYRPGCSVLVGDVLFREALTWLMAAKLAPGLARNKMTAEDAMKMYEHFIARAKAINATEQQQDPSTGDADWITGR
jgi:hypothetical protein